MAVSALYGSSKFPPDSTNIRILKLLPGKPTDPIRCQLEVFDLKQKPEYEALSYCWGSTAFPRAIICNKTWVVIGRNLHSALSHFRDEKDTRALWVDALCINQKDLGEKTYQVRMMADIYRQARKVQIWLGKESKQERSDAAVKFIRDLPLRLETQTLQEAVNLFDDLVPYFYILQRPWFRRVWVIQEVAVAHGDCILHSGEATVGWNDFIKTFSRITESGFAVFAPLLAEYPAAINAARGKEALVKAGLDLHPNLRSDLLSILVRHRRFQASNKRDKVFALAAIVSYSNEDDFRIQPNYRLGVEQVYRQVAEGLLRQNRNLDILGVPRALDGKGLQELPSWVPDWSVSHLPTPARLAGLANLDFNASSCSRPKVSIKGDRLILSGMVFDEILEVGWVLTRSSRDLQLSIGIIFDNLRRQTATIFNWERVARLPYQIPFRRPAAYVGGGRLTSAYRCTIVGGLEHTLNNSQEEWLEFKHWYDNLARFRLLHTLGLDRLLVTFIVCNLAFTLFASVFSLFFKFVLGYSECPWEFVHLNFQNKIDLAASCKRMVRTRKGYIGLAPQNVETGDSVALFEGGKDPIVIREKGIDLSAEVRKGVPKRQENAWELVGACYVHGIMQGEAFDFSKCVEMVVV